MMPCQDQHVLLVTALQQPRAEERNRGQRKWALTLAPGGSLQDERLLPGGQVTQVIAVEMNSHHRLNELRRLAVDDDEASSQRLVPVHDGLHRLLQGRGI